MMKNRLIITLSTLVVLHFPISANASTNLLLQLNQLKNDLLAGMMGDFKPTPNIINKKKTNQANKKTKTVAISQAPKPQPTSNLLPQAQQDYFYDKIALREPEQERKPVLSFFKQKVGYTEQDRAVIKYKRALNSIKIGRKEKAMELLTQLLEEYPQYQQVRLALVDLYQQAGFLDEAGTLLKDGLLVDNYNPEFINRLASIMQQTGDTTNSLNLLLKTPEQYKHEPKYKSLLAHAYFKEGMHDLARTYYQQLVRIDERNSSWWLGLAVAEDSLGNYKRALQSFNNAKMLANLEPEVLYYINQRIKVLSSIM